MTGTAQSKRRIPDSARLRQLLTVGVILAMVVIGFVFCLFRSPDAVSEAERRPLAQRPALSGDALLSGAFMEDFGKYATDQFPGRESLRQIKAVSRFYLLCMGENNDIYLKEGSAIKKNPSYDESILRNNVALWSRISDMFPGARRYCSLIPDKQFYAAGGRYPHMDDQALEETVLQGMPEGTEYLSLYRSDLLRLGDYYRTDLHWRQEAIWPVAKMLADRMGTEIDGEDAYKWETLGNFYGVYCGQSALPLTPDLLRIGQSQTLAGARVFCYRMADGRWERTEVGVYDREKSRGADGYSVFLAGSEALVEIRNPACHNGKVLAVFRDSFSSSLMPYLISGYERILLVDTRYMASDLLRRMPELRLGEVTDLLFLYSTTALSGVVMR